MSKITLEVWAPGFHGAGWQLLCFQVGACVFEVGNFLPFQADSCMRRGTLQTQLHFMCHSQVGWSWCWNGVWAWKNKERGWRACAHVCVHACLRMHTCASRVMGVVGRTSGWSGVYLPRGASREGSLLLPQFLPCFSFLCVKFVNKSSTGSSGNIDLGHGFLSPIFVTFKMEHTSPLGVEAIWGMSLVIIIILLDRKNSQSLSGSKCCWWSIPHFQAAIDCSYVQDVPSSDLSVLHRKLSFLRGVKEETNT